VPAFYFGAVHYALGDPAAALSLGRQAYGERCDYLIYLGIEPRAGILAKAPVLTRFLTALHQ
jgi:hypothetical protein